MNASHKTLCSVKHKHFTGLLWCQQREEGIVLVTSRCMYKGGYSLLSQQKLLWGSVRHFSDFFPQLKTVAGRCCHCCYSDTGFILRLVELLTSTSPFQPSDFPIILHRRITKVLAETHASTPRVFSSFIHFRLCSRQDTV